MNTLNGLGATRKCRRQVLAALLLTAVAGAQSVHAQTAGQAYPNRPIRLVVGFPPGGSSDATARLLGAALSTKLGQPVIVDNKPGANTVIAAQYVKSQPADGYTLLAAQSSFVISPSLQKLNYDIATDFTSVALVGVIPLVMVTPNELPAKSMAELVAMAKAQPGKLSYASYGAGSAGHIASELILSRAGVDMVHVPYKGSGPAIVDVIGNQVAMMLATVTASMGVAKEGKVRAIAVTSGKRVAALPDVPTVAESGMPNYELVEWEAIQAPAGTPKDVVDTLNKAFREVVASPELRAKMATLGIEADGTKTPAEVRAFVQNERDKFAKIVQDRGIKLQ
ncbi:tripartite tricarboxylate transporter substrate binding protein [Variovorax saccharolyticus]|uniref:tripartite tricarboxylate transporter substrate binding protein n=1 Tax=Variovorax saccharolyticus TaxID=3053516 RepID=UPI002576FFE0|nr:tripartite tricarboxylate transporter substrate binding protein [Variovorax sp. J31P216]MDM0029230.1 tripartite tricarboxylate transporter substrate binding protein [Variovorax sp. J31P216]